MNNDEDGKDIKKKPFSHSRLSEAKKKDQMKQDFKKSFIYYDTFSKKLDFYSVDTT